MYAAQYEGLMRVLGEIRDQLSVPEGDAPAEGPERATVTVMVSPELVSHLGTWTGPVQIKITEIPYGPSAVTHMIDVRPVSDEHLPCRWCRATVGHNVGCMAHGE